MRNFLYKFIKWFGMALIFVTTVECMNENTLVPLIAPLIGIPLMLTFWFLAEYCRREGAKGGANK